jgi:hypothetical protein
LPAQHLAKEGGSLCPRHRQRGLGGVGLGLGSLDARTGHSSRACPSAPSARGIARGGTRPWSWSRRRNRVARSRRRSRSRGFRGAQRRARRAALPGSRAAEPRPREPARRRLDVRRPQATRGSTQRPPDLDRRPLVGRPRRLPHGSRDRLVRRHLPRVPAPPTRPPPRRAASPSSTVSTSRRWSSRARTTRSGHRRQARTAPLSASRAPTR